MERLFFVTIIFAVLILLLQGAAYSTEYTILLHSGGKLEASSYDIEGEKIKVYLASPKDAVIEISRTDVENIIKKKEESEHTATQKTIGGTTSAVQTAELDIIDKRDAAEREGYPYPKSPLPHVMYGDRSLNVDRLSILKTKLIDRFGSELKGKKLILTQFYVMEATVGPLITSGKPGEEIPNKGPYVPTLISEITLIIDGEYLSGSTFMPLSKGSKATETTLAIATTRAVNDLIKSSDKTSNVPVLKTPDGTIPSKSGKQLKSNACAGDNLLRLTEQSNLNDQSEAISIAKKGVFEILDGLETVGEIKASLQKIDPKNVIHDDKPLKLTDIDSQLVVSRAATSISFARNSIIITTGSLHISHSGNNIIISGGDIEISNDGGIGIGSLVVSKGKIKISHAHNTLIYAIKGAEISFANDVQAFNTSERKSSHGDIINTVVEPLFIEEKSLDKSLQPAKPISSVGPQSSQTSGNATHNASTKTALSSRKIITEHQMAISKSGKTLLFVGFAALWFLIGCLIWKFHSQKTKSR